jgi:NAD(P)-dependent dehydrogenase (short-subunit alcohol dehydrogenase family)
MQNYSLITGSAGLLGEFHAAALLEIGHNLIITDLDLIQLKKLKEKLISKYSSRKIIPLRMDVTSEKSINSVKKIIQNHGGIVNNLINNAAIDAKIKGSKNRLFEKFNLDEWNREVNVGLTGAMLCSKIFGGEMVKRKVSGTIINIASDLSVIAPNQNLYKIKNQAKFTKPVTYSVIKHGIVGLTKYLASYWGEKNIRVNSLSPGSVLNDQSNALQKNLKKEIPMKRLAKKNEYMGAIQFLSSKNSDYMTGQNIIIDGGRSIW